MLGPGEEAVEPESKVSSHTHSLSRYWLPVQLNGPVPHGFYVGHLDSNKHSNDIDNLTLLKRKKGRRITNRPTCLECDRLSRQRGLCHRPYQRLRAKEKGR